VSVNSGVGRGVMLERTGEGGMARMRGSVRTSASDDFTRIAAEQARVRLDLEREERLARMKERLEARRKESEGYGSEVYLSGESKYSEHSEKEGGGDGKGKEKEVDKEMVDRVDWEKEGRWGVGRGCLL